MIKDFLQGLSVPEVSAIEKYYSEQLGTQSPLMIIKELASGSANDQKEVISRCLQAIDLHHHPSSAGQGDLSSVLAALQKQLLQCRTMSQSMSSSRTQAVLLLLDDVVRTARQWEAYDVLADSLSLQKYLRGEREGHEIFIRLHSQALAARDCGDKLTEMVDFLHYVSYKQVYTAHNREALILEVSAAIRKYNDWCRSTGSRNMQYYLIQLEAELADLKRDYSACLSKCREVRRMLRTPLLAMASRQIAIRMKIARLHMLNDTPSKALSSLIKAQRECERDSFTYISILKLKLLCQLQLRKSGEAGQIVDYLLQLPVSGVGTLRSGLFLYYKATVLFVDGRYRECLQLLMRPLEIEKDKANFNVARRILFIQALVEMNKQEEASAACEALRKFISRKSNISERLLLISKALLLQEKTCFNGSGQSTAISDILEKLESKASRYSWDNPALEPLRFDLWLQKRQIKNKR